MHVILIDIYLTWEQIDGLKIPKFMPSLSYILQQWTYWAKKSSFFKLKKEREKREKKEVYHTIVCPKSQFLLCKTGPGLQMSCGSTAFNLIPRSRIVPRPDSR